MSITNDSDDHNQGLPIRKERVVNPLAARPAEQGSGPAVDMLRQKIDKLYADEPDAKEELQESEAVKTRSRHQQFMHELSTSGKSLAEIQNSWHEYYVNLPNEEKHEVWQEFYRNHNKLGEQPSSPKPAPVVTATPMTPQRPSEEPTELRRPSNNTMTSRTISEIKQQLLTTVLGRTKKQTKPGHLQSLLFGLGMGALVLFVLLFSFFNERFIAPFITPSKSVSNTPIIIDPNTTAVGTEAKIIIPKINVEIPVVYDEPSIEESAVQTALERGVLHYATTPNPGEIGNGVIFGHSSNNILNRGKYKFAFVLLKQLENGDTFIIQKDGKRFVYRIYEKRIVAPSEVGVLGHAGKQASMTLITCDPPGTTINRLVVIGEQISPDPSTNIASKVTPQATSQVPQTIPSDAPSLWQRIRNLFTS
ncbi:MAG: hypothetical protein JWL85_354 [Candidatus Saccharibacteria bacterium]|nr:hypothetical protein [Candidatus Saccharibacteria bacterium]